MQVSKAMISITGLLHLFGFSAIAESPSEFKAQYQFNKCEFESTESIWKFGSGEVCGIRQTVMYSDPSCPVLRYKSCPTFKNGFFLTQDPGTANRDLSWERGWQDGLGSIEQCKAEVDHARGVIERSVDTQHIQITITHAKWEGSDTRDPIFNNRIKASNNCIYTYKQLIKNPVVNRNEACGVEAYSECKQQKIFNECRHESFGWESYKIKNGFNIQCGMNLDPDKGEINDDKGISILNRVQNKNRQFHVAVPVLCENESFDSKLSCLGINLAFFRKINADPKIATSKTKDIELTIKNAIGLHFIAIYNSTRSEKRKIAGNADLVLQKEIKNFRMNSTLKNLYKSKPEELDEYFFELSQLAISDVPADENWKAVLSLTKLSLVKGRNEYDNPVYYQLLNQDLNHSGRIRLSLLGDLKILLRSVDWSNRQSNSRRGDAIMIVEFYSRLLHKFVQQRASDILKLQKLISDDKKLIEEWSNKTETIVGKINDLNIEESSAQAIGLELTRYQNNRNLLSAANHLVDVMKSELYRSVEEGKSLAKELSSDDEIFGILHAYLNLTEGSYNNALLDMKEWVVSAKSFQDSVDPLESFGNIVKIAKVHFREALGVELKKAIEVYNSISSVSDISLDQIAFKTDDSQFSYELLEILDSFSLEISEDMTGSKVKILKLIKENIILPLQESGDRLP